MLEAESVGTAKIKSLKKNGAVLVFVLEFIRIITFKDIKLILIFKCKIKYTGAPDRTIKMRRLSIILPNETNVTMRCRR